MSSLMTRVAVMATAVLAAVLMAGCGGGGSGSAVEDALSFIPKDAPVVATLATDPDGDQWKKVDRLAGKFPFAGQAKTQLKQDFNSNTHLDFDKDLKPILGNDAVFAVPTVAGLRAADTPSLIALKVDDEGKAKDFVEKDATKAGSFEGTDVYKEQQGNSYLAVKDGVIVVADSTADLQAALKRHDGGDHITQDDFNARLAGVKGGGLLEVGVNVEQILAQEPRSADARKVRWVSALRNAGASVIAEDDGIETDFKATTAGGLSPRDLPLAAGAQAPPVVRRATDVGVGLRDLAQTWAFIVSTARITDPSGYARFQKRKARLDKALGIDIDRDVIAQLTGDAAVSVGLDGGFAVRSELRDPKAFQATLRKAAPKLERALRDQHVGVVVPKKPNGFYALATATGKRYVFAVIGGRFVLATDPARAGQFAVQSATPVAGAKGSLAVAMDARSIANAVAGMKGVGEARLFTGSLGDLVGSVESETSGLDGHFKLTIK